jgi:hypothetical protein
MRNYERFISVALVFAASSLLMACAPAVAPVKPPPAKPAADMFRDRNAYMEQYFSPSVLPEQLRKALEAADSKPVSFSRITFTSRRKVFSDTGQVPVTYLDQAVYQNAGNGLVQMMVTVQSNGFDISTSFSLSYRGYVGLLLQNVPSTAYSLPPVIQVRSVEHFEPVMSSNSMSYAFHSGYVGNSRIYSPYQMYCHAGRSYSGTVINGNIQGSVREMECQITNANGVVTQTRTYGYLEQYGVALTLHSKTPANQENMEVTDFKVE